MVCSPGWKQDPCLPRTPARTQLFGLNDLATVTAIQASYDLTPLSAFLGTGAPPAGAMPDFPTWVEGSQFDERFFGYLDFMISLLERPGEGEQALWDRLARLGIGPENTFDFAAQPPDIQVALKAGVRAGFRGCRARGSFLIFHQDPPPPIPSATSAPR